MLIHEHVIVSPMGLCARPSSWIVESVCTKASEVEVQRVSDEPDPHGHDRANAKSIMGIMLLAAPKGDILRFTIDGPDEKEVLESLKKALAVFDEFEGP